MSAQNTKTLSKIWQVVDIVHHISLLSEPAATLALACTCKAFFWHKMYEQNFPCNINTDIDWLEWQLEQEQRAATITITDAGNETATRFTWFQRYNQRVNMGLNWQANKSTSTVQLDFPIIDKLVKLQDDNKSLMATYPGWLAVLDCISYRINLVKLLPKNTVKIAQLDLKRNKLITVKSITFYRLQEQVNGIDERMRLIVHLTDPNVLELWNTNSCELLQSIELDVEWDGRIIGASLLFSKSHGYRDDRLFYSNFSKSHLCEPQSFKASGIGYEKDCSIHTANNNEMILLRYSTHNGMIYYKIIRHNRTQSTEIISGYLSFDHSTVGQLRVYSIDYDRILFCYNIWQNDTSPNDDINTWKRYIKVISISEEDILEREYTANGVENLILISTYNLIIFYPHNYASFTVISLLNGEIRHRINTNGLNSFECFQHLMDTKIVGCSYATQQYCVIDAVTGSINIHPFSIPTVHKCIFTFGHMVLVNMETTFITSFVPE
ncbi:hypothetical protein BDF19DRAFT_448540 [Syncephalis fuscata]|nr:hypothetical protein BDF19DRAFT_448540 [Syncephalis fuscata]